MQDLVPPHLLQQFLTGLPSLRRALAAIAVPYLATRCAIPDKIAADHKELDALLDAFEAGLRRLLSRDMAQATMQRTLLPRVQVRCCQGCCGMSSPAARGLPPGCVAAGVLAEEEATSWPRAASSHHPPPPPLPIPHTLSHGPPPSSLQADFVRLRSMIEPHLREEEQEVLPLMRRHFTPQEIEKHVVSKIMRSLDGESIGVFLRALSREERRAFMKQEHIPFFVRWILNHHAAKYERRVWRPFQRLCLHHLNGAAPAASH